MKSLLFKFLRRCRMVSDCWFLSLDVLVSIMFYAVNSTVGYLKTCEFGDLQSCRRSSSCMWDQAELLEHFAETVHSHISRK